MNTPVRRALAALAALLTTLIGSGVAAQPTVWRCEGAEGVRYSAQACSGGRALAVADRRSTAQVEQGHAVVARERQLLARLVAERLQREREATAGAVRIGGSAATTDSAGVADGPAPRSQRDGEAARPSPGDAAPALRPRRPAA